MDSESRPDEPDTSLCTRLAALVAQPASPCDFVSTTSVDSSPLVLNARRSAVAAHGRLDALVANLEAALLQLEVNRDAALAAIQADTVAGTDPEAVLAAFSSGVDAVQTAAASKRTRLEEELVAADAALGEAIDATVALTEATVALDDAALEHLAPALSARFAAAQAAVAAISERPFASSFLAVEPILVGSNALCGDAAGLLGALAVVWDEEPPMGLSHAQAAQLQAWLPLGGSPSPGAWQEVYRATTHGFGAAAFHRKCDGRARLLVLIQAKEGGWLFGGFTAVGFSPPSRWYTDPAAFLFSLTNSLGRPEKLESMQKGEEVRYLPSFSAAFGGGIDLYVCDFADTEANSFTYTGNSFAIPASPGVHPMAQGWRHGWLAAEVVAWVV